MPNVYTLNLAKFIKAYKVVLNLTYPGQVLSADQARLFCDRGCLGLAAM